MIKIKVKKREVKTDVEKDEIKAVIYGAGVSENIVIAVSMAVFEKTYLATGTSQIIELDVEGESYEVLVKDFFLDPVTDKFTHIDFYAIKRGEIIEVVVPFEFMGEAPAIDDGNILNKVMLDVLVRTLPKNIPANIEIDLSKIKTVLDSIRLSDINLPEGVKFVTENLDDVIISASQPKEEVEVEEETAEKLEEVLADKSKDENQSEEKKKED